MTLVIGFTDKYDREIAGEILEDHFQKIPGFGPRNIWLKVTPAMLRVLESEKKSKNFKWKVLSESGIKSTLKKHREELKWRVSGVHLWDIRKQNYPDERGDTFRSLQVFECRICGALTNLVMMGGVFPMLGTRIGCPNGHNCWHHDLEDKINHLSLPHPSSYKKELENEIKKLKQQYAKKIKNDLRGKVNMKLKQGVSNPRSFKPDSTGKWCKHFL